MRPVSPALACLGLLTIAVPAGAATQVIDNGPFRGQTPGFEPRRIGPDGTVAGTYGPLLLADNRAAIARDGKVTALDSPSWSWGTDVAGDGTVVGYGASSEILRWSPPTLGWSSLRVALAPPRLEGSGNPLAWITDDGTVVHQQGERLEASTRALVNTGWVDGVRLGTGPQSANFQDGVNITDVAETGWIVAEFARLELLTAGSDTYWQRRVEGWAQFDGTTTTRTFTGSRSTEFQPTLVDDVGTLYGRKSGVPGSMRLGSTTFEAVAAPVPGEAFDLSAVAGDGIVLARSAGADGSFNTSDDGAFVRRGTGPWASVRAKIPAAHAAASRGLHPVDVNAAGDLLIRTSGASASDAGSIVIRSRTRITGAVAAPPAAPTRAAAVKVVATSLDGLPAVTATVANGRYELLLAAGRWTIALSGATGCAGTGACATTKTLTVDGEHDQTLAWRTDPATNPAPTTIRKGARLKARKGKLAIPLRCRLVSRRCTGTIALLPKKGTKPLATTALNARPGTRTTATLTLPKAVKTRIAGKKTIPIRIRITTRLTGTTTTTITAAILD